MLYRKNHKLAQQTIPNPSVSDYTNIPTIQQQSTKNLMWCSAFSSKMPFYTLLHASKTSAQHVIYLLPTLVSRRNAGLYQMIRMNHWLCSEEMNPIDLVTVSRSCIHRCYSFHPTQIQREKWRKNLEKEHSFCKQKSGFWIMAKLLMLIFNPQ